MNLSEQVAQLQAALPKLKANDQDFAISLIASFKKWNKLSPKQEPWIGKLLERTVTPVVAAPVVAVTNVGGFAGVIALFTAAKAHLKFPKVRLQVEGKTVVLSLNGPKSKAPGAVSLTSEGAYGHRSYYGRVSLDGAFTPANACYGAFLEALTALLTQFSQNPARVAKEHGKLTGNCCFCNKVLGLGEDKRSVAVGFGPVCADHYGLKAEWLSGVAKAEAKAELAGAEAPVPAPVQAAIDAAIAQSDAESLAESLAKATGAVSVTVTDGSKVDSYGANPGDLGDYTPLLTPEQTDVEAAKLNHLAFLKAQEQTAAQAQMIKCFFCEKLSAETAVVKGYVVCPSCAKQLS